MRGTNEIPDRFDYVARVLAARLSKVIANRWGDALGMYCVAEYPKSGGTWVAGLLADCLSVPLIQQTRLPIAMPSIIHGHWSPARRAPHTLYVYRDGRDVMVSYYFHVMRSTPRGLNARPAYLTGDARTDLPRFMQDEFRRPRSSRLNWADHVGQWLADAEQPKVTYEALLKDGKGELVRILRDLGADVDPERAREAIDRHAFSRLTQREPGQADPSSFLRKGVSGDWRNYFTRTAGEVFHALAGDALTLVGYEDDASWIDALPDD